MDNARPSSETQPVAMLLEESPTLRELEKLVLEDKGLQVIVPPEKADFLGFVKQNSPSVIVMHVRWNHPEDVAFVDQLRTDPQTLPIPFVVISTSDETAAMAQAAPNVREAVVAPYDIDALQDAVGYALKIPLPEAVPAPRSRQVSPQIQFAAAELRKNARKIVLGALEEVRRVEPYKSHFPRLATGLVDDLGTLIGAMIHGLELELSPAEVFCIPGIRDSIAHHVEVRKTQGLGPVAAVREDQILQTTMDGFLIDLVGTSGFTAMDAIDAMTIIRDYVAELIRMIVSDYAM